MKNVEPNNPVNHLVSGRIMAERVEFADGVAVVLVRCLNAPASPSQEIDRMTVPDEDVHDLVMALTAASVVPPVQYEKSILREK